MSPEEAETFLVETGCFARREDGWIRAVKPPRTSDLPRFVAAVKALSVWSVATTVAPARVRVTRGGGSDDLLWKVERRP